jgi:ribosome-associated translation inhibitor RaiA
MTISTTDEIIRQISRLKNVDVQIEKDTFYNNNKWLVRLTWRHDADRIVVEETDALFSEAIGIAWEKLHRNVVKGQGVEALTPEALPKPDDYRD